MVRQRDSKTNRITEKQIGWFVGWIEKNDKKVIFASFLLDKKPEKSFASLRAKTIAIKKLELTAIKD